MAATRAAFHTRIRFVTLCKRLRSAGKPRKLALIAVLRKMPMTLDAMLRNSRDFTT